MRITAEACRILLFFFLYGFLGWCVESAICSAVQGRLVNRGFLNGPLCPVYGFGAMACIYLLTPVERNTVLLYVASTLLVSAVEYVTGWLLETLFHTRWWDYSHYRFNLKGRVCLPNALFFGVLGVFALRVIQPAVSRLLGSFSDLTAVWLASACTTLLAVDLALSVRAALQLSGKLDALQSALAEIRERTDAAIGEKRLQAALFASMTVEERIEALLEAGESRRLRERLERLSQSHGAMHRRMLDAFPHMQFPRAPSAMDAFRAGVERFRSQRRKGGKAGR